MSTPKSIYSQSEARRLRDQPCPDCGQMGRICPDCGQMGRISRNLQDDQSGKLDPDVAVTWYCPNVICNRHDGFWIETQ